MLVAVVYLVRSRSGILFPPWSAEANYRWFPFSFDYDLKFFGNWKLLLTVTILSKVELALRVPKNVALWLLAAPAADNALKALPSCE